MLNFHWMQRIHWPNTSEGLVEMAKQLEDANIESVLMPYGPGGNDFSMFLPDIFRSTKKIRIIIAAGAYAVTPEYVAKTFFTAQKFGDNRVDLNLVAGRYSDEFEQMVIDKYPGDSSLVDTHTKRVAMTEKWMEKFVSILKDEEYTTKLMVVGSSETTIRIANNYTDYMIINGDILIDGKRGQLTNTKPILCIDPLILEDGMSEDDVEYNEYKFVKKNQHHIKGTYEQVKQEIKELATGNNINDFMIHTDQKNINQLLRLVKDLSQKVD